MRLIVTVVSVSDLKHEDFFSSCDPYVKVILGERDFRTKHLSNTNSGTYNEHFSFFGTYDASATLIIEVYNACVFGDQRMCLQRVPLLSVGMQQGATTTHELRFEGLHGGSITIKLHPDFTLTANSVVPARVPASAASSSEPTSVPGGGAAAQPQPQQQQTYAYQPNPQYQQYQPQQHPQQQNPYHYPSQMVPAYAHTAHAPPRYPSAAGFMVAQARAQQQQQQQQQPSPMQHGVPPPLFGNSTGGASRAPPPQRRSASTTSAVTPPPLFGGGSSSYQPLGNPYDQRQQYQNNYPTQNLTYGPPPRGGPAPVSTITSMFGAGGGGMYY